MFYSESFIVSRPDLLTPGARPRKAISPSVIVTRHIPDRGYFINQSRREDSMMESPSQPAGYVATVGNNPSSL